MALCMVRADLEGKGEKGTASSEMRGAIGLRKVIRSKFPNAARVKRLLPVHRLVSPIPQG